MRYDWRESLGESPGSIAYFREIDRRFLASARSFMPWRQIPFDTVIPFGELHNRDVLEIGVGHGTHAQLLSPNCKSFTGIDLTRTATRMTATRLKLFDVPGSVLQMDAECMGFPERSFDAFTATYSSSHGYHALATLASAAQRAGLDRKTALTAAAHALADGIHYWRESALSVDELLQEAVTPGGIAAATMAAMDKAGYRRAVQRGIQAGITQARRNAPSHKARKATTASS